jgi:hypothetical protein
MTWLLVGGAAGEGLAKTRVPIPLPECGRAMSLRLRDESMMMAAAARKRETCSLAPATNNPA